MFPTIRDTDAGLNQSQTSTDASAISWFALQVRARREFGVSEHLRSNGFEGFLPTYKLSKRWSDRIKEAESPLFPGYLFCRFDPWDRLPILKIPGVIQIVGCNRQPIPVDEGEIRAIQALVASGIPNQRCPYLKVGDKVQIESGPLRGLAGLLVEFQGHQRLVLSVTLLQRSVAVKIDSAFVTSQCSSTVPHADQAFSAPGGMQLVLQS
jgi:transcription antitermination factor NusG